MILLIWLLPVRLGIDSVKITKVKDKVYKIDFAALDSYENFINRLKQN